MALDIDELVAALKLSSGWVVDPWCEPLAYNFLELTSDGIAQWINAVFPTSQTP